MLRRVAHRAARPVACAAQTACFARFRLGALVAPVPAADVWLLRHFSEKARARSNCGAPPVGVPTTSSGQAHGIKVQRQHEKEEKRQEGEKKSPRGPFAKYIRMARQYGLPLVIYYLSLNEAFVLAITYLLHYDYLGAGDVISWVKYFGMGQDLDTDALMDRSRTFGPITITARFITNFTIATVFMSIWTFAQLPFCIATLPYAMRVFGRKASQEATAKSAAAAAKSAV